VQFRRNSYGEVIDNTVEKNSSVFTRLVAVGKGMRAVKLCTNKILHFLTGGAGGGYAS